MALSYEYSDQGGYPYYYTGITPSAIAKAQKDGKEMTEDRADYIGKISYNDRSSYRRDCSTLVLTSNTKPVTLY